MNSTVTSNVHAICYGLTVVQMDVARGALTWLSHDEVMQILKDAYRVTVQDAFMLGHEMDRVWGRS